MPAVLAPVFIGEVRQLPGALGRGDDFLRSAGVPLSLAQTWHNVTRLDVQESLGVLTGVVGTAADVTLVVVISLYLSIDGRALIAAARQLFHERERGIRYRESAVRRRRELKRPTRRAIAR